MDDDKPTKDHPDTYADIGESYALTTLLLRSHPSEDSFPYWIFLCQLGDVYYDRDTGKIMRDSDDIDSPEVIWEGTAEEFDEHHSKYWKVRMFYFFTV